MQRKVAKTKVASRVTNGVREDYLLLWFSFSCWKSEIGGMRSYLQDMVLCTAKRYIPKV